MQTMASMDYFDSRRKNLTYILKWKSVMEMHVITKATKPSCLQLLFLHVLHLQLDGDAIKLLIFSNLMAF